MVTIFKFVFFFILVIFVLRILSPLILTFAMKRLQKNMEKKFRNFENFNKKPNSDKKKPDSEDKVGEYIDFEEID